jgi:hypothetical protein
MPMPEAHTPTVTIDETHNGPPEPRMRRPLHPWLVMAAAVLLPGAGQVLNRMPTRALTMLFFMLALGFVTLQLAAPERSFVGKHAGGIFVYAISVLDAYSIARYRWELFRRRNAARV